MSDIFNSSNVAGQPATEPTLEQMFAWDVVHGWPTKDPHLTVPEFWYKYNSGTSPNTAPQGQTPPAGTSPNPLGGPVSASQSAASQSVTSGVTNTAGNVVKTVTSPPLFIVLIGVPIAIGLGGTRFGPFVNLSLLAVLIGTFVLPKG